jgi:putative Holliday junction resolvase
VAGLPKSLDGSLKIQAEKVLQYIDHLKKRFSQSIVTWDERLSTVAAERTLRETETGRKKKKQMVNELAAQWILQGYMDYQKNSAQKTIP